MDERFERLKADYSQDYTPPWGLPTQEDFAYLEKQYGVRYPPSFIAFQTKCAAGLPQPDNAFRWANRGLEPYLSLEDAILSGRRMGIPDELAPFWEDENNYLCFDTGVVGPDGEMPVVFWDHEGGIGQEAASFIEWLSRAYKR